MIFCMSFILCKYIALYLLLHPCFLPTNSFLSQINLDARKRKKWLFLLICSQFYAILSLLWKNIKLSIIHSIQIIYVIVFSLLYLLKISSIILTARSWQETQFQLSGDLGEYNMELSTKMWIELRELTRNIVAFEMQLQQQLRLGKNWSCCQAWAWRNKGEANDTQPIMRGTVGEYLLTDMHCNCPETWLLLENMALKRQSIEKTYNNIALSPSLWVLLRILYQSKPTKSWWLRR